MTDTQRSWEKRLTAKPDELTMDYVESLSYDKKLYKYDIVGSIAQATMHAQQKFITQAELKAIKDGLVAISEDIEAGRFKFDRACEDIHMAIEAALIGRIGEPGRQVGRADQVQVRDVKALSPDILAREIVEDLQAALVQFQAIAEDLGEIAQ